ncbi:hypothetical protein F5Y09DRAFT_22237 [Xylaria sp. FL1042]|nr:hypothetical protein F5Y09DRAFT_22237 [Xylaria sp. FL1042]
MALLVYVVGNVGLFLNERCYAALLVLRAIQSLGASAAYAISFGVVADLCPPSERGCMLGPISMALNLRACVGPVAGGVVAYKSQSYVWVFYFLIIVGAVLLGGVGLFLPETARSLVGDGSDPSRFKSWQLSWIGLLLRHVKHATNGQQGAKHGLSEQPENESARLRPNFGIFLAYFHIIFHKDTIFTL